MVNKVSNLAKSLQIEMLSAYRSSAYRHALRNKNISDDHADKRLKVLKKMCVVLVDECGLKVKSIHNIRMKHIRAYAEYMDRSGVSPRSVVNALSIVRVFFHRILARPGVVPSANELFKDDKRFIIKKSTSEDKSWRAKGINFKDIFRRIFEKDPFVAVQVLLCVTFSLRRREAICFRPFECDHTDYIDILYGPKNGRPRRVEILSDVQRYVLEYVKQFVNHSYGSTIPDGYTLNEWKSHFDYIVRTYGHISKKDLGVTLLGLRHQTLGDIYELITGFPPPVRGHSISQPDEVVLDRLARKFVTEQAGHARLDITGAYLGAMQGRLTSRRIDAFIKSRKDQDT